MDVTNLPGSAYSWRNFDFANLMLACCCLSFVNEEEEKEGELLGLERHENLRSSVCDWLLGMPPFHSSLSSKPFPSHRRNRNGAICMSGICKVFVIIFHSLVAERPTDTGTVLKVPQLLQEENIYIYQFLCKSMVNNNKFLPKIQDISNSPFTSWCAGSRGQVMERVSPTRATNWIRK